jgi:hypothetical protein
MRCNLFGSFGLPTAVATLVLVAGSVLAQGQPERGGRPERPMGGPAVERSRPAQVEERFSQPMGPGGREAGMGQRVTVPHPEFMAVVWMLSDQEAPEALRLNGEQEKKIAELDREFQDASRAHSQRVRELARPNADAAAPTTDARRGETPARRGADGADGERPGRPDAAPPAPGPERRRLSEEDRERIEQLRQSAPRPAEAQAKIYAQLTDTQRIFVQEEIEDRRRVLERQRDEEMMRRRAAMRDGGGMEGRGGPEAMAQRQRVGRIFQRLQQMPPEERDRIMIRLEQELDRRAKELGLEDLPAMPERGWGGRGMGGEPGEPGAGRPQRRGPAGGQENDGQNRPEGERPRRGRPGGGDGAPPRI